jgi:hypothetical protein
LLLRISDVSDPLIYDISDENFSLTKKNDTSTETDTIKIVPLGESMTIGFSPDYPDSLEENPGYRRSFASSTCKGRIQG